MFRRWFKSLAVGLLSLAIAIGPVLPAVAGSPAAAQVATNGPTLLGYINYLVNSGHQVSGVTLNIFSATPLDAINFGTGGIGTSTASWTGTGVNAPVIAAPGPNTGITPAIINTFVVAPLSACGAGPWFYNTCNNAAPNDWVSQSQGAQNAHRLLDVVLIMANPAGSGNNPWTSGGGVLNAGSATQNQLYANLATIVPALKSFRQPFVISMQGELNLSGGYTNPQCWFAIGSATSLQAGQLFRLVKNYFISQGLGNILWAFETNAGVGNYLFGFPGAQIQGGGWTGPGSADLILLDGAPMYFDTNAYPAMQSTGLPMAFGSAVPSVANRNAINLYTGAGMAAPGIGLQAVAADYTHFFGYILWSQYSGAQGTALNYQQGAAQALAAAPYTSTIWPGVFFRAK